MSLEQTLEERVDALLQQGTLLAYLAEVAVGSHKVRDRGTKSQPKAVRHLKGKLTKFVIEDAGAGPLDAREEFIGASRIVGRVQSARPLAGLSFLPNIVIEDPNGHPQEVGNGFLKGKDGVSLEGLTDLCPDLFALGASGFTLPRRDELHLPERYAARNRGADNYAGQTQHCLPHRSTSSHLSGSWRILSAPVAAGLHEGCMGTVPTPVTARRPAHPPAAAPVCQTGWRWGGAGWPMARAMAVRSSSERLWSDWPPRTGLA
jgi:hypothetical protein